jgi:hypothetical protein
MAGGTDTFVFASYAAGTLNTRFFQNPNPGDLQNPSFESSDLSFFGGNPSNTAYQLRYGSSLNPTNPSPNDTIELWQDDGTGSNYTFQSNATYLGTNPGNLVIVQNSGNPFYSLIGAGVFSSYNSGQLYSFSTTAFCFLTGTHITTPTGEVLIEDLNIGDVISTADGGSRKVMWIGKQTLSSTFTPTKNLPIEITIGALGNNLPTRPLRVSPGHSLLVGGVFPIASALVNDITVRQMTKEELPDTFTYYHIEVEDHALILAEGIPAETFLDASSRRAFSNFNEYVELYGEDEREVPRSDLHYKRILKFDNLSQELKETIGYPLSYDEMKVA